MRLDPAALDLFPPADVEVFGYDRETQGAAIVHFGIGAFHRAHQAWYTDRAMDAGDRDWMINGVSLRSGDVAEQMNPQAGLYSVTERSGTGTSLRVVGSVREVVIAPGAPERVGFLLGHPDTKIISFTVTEKGYCRAADGTLDPARADARSFYPLLARALRQRRASRLPGLTLLSCDNLADNGAHLMHLSACIWEKVQ